MPVLTTICAVFLLVTAVMSKTWWQVGIYIVLLGYCVYWFDRERREVQERKFRKANPDLTRGTGTEAGADAPAKDDPAA